MKWMLALLVFAAATGVARADDDPFQPLPGRDVVKPIKADWCDNAGELSLDGSVDDAIHRVERTVGSGWSDKSLRAVAELGCLKPSDPAIQKAVARFRQGYVNLIGWSEAEDRAAMKLRVSPQWTKQREAYCKGLAPDAEASVETKIVGEATAFGTGCALDNRSQGEALEQAAQGWDDDLGWWLDVTAEPRSEVARAVHVNRCLRILNQKAWPDAQRTAVMNAFATCGPEAGRLDRKRLDAEIASLPEVAQIHARETFAQARTVYAFLDGEYGKLAAKDPAYKKLLYDAPEAGWTGWEADYKAHQAALDAAIAYERLYYGPSKKALLGCGASLRKGFSDYIRSKKPATTDDARRAALDQVGYPLLAALAVCDGAEGRLQLAQTEVNLLTGDGQGVPNMRRGPRHAAYYAAAAALGEIVSDRNKFPVQLAEFHLKMSQPQDHNMVEGARDYFTNKVTFVDDPRGVIDAVKKDGDSVVVTFKAVKTTVPNRICTPNGRVLRIDAGGNFIYDVDCVTKGTVTLTSKEPALIVPAVVADGLAAGQLAVFSGDDGRDGRKRNGMPKVIYADKDGKKMVAWYGVRL